MLRFTWICTLFFACFGTLEAAEPTPEEIFQKRLMPIFQSPNPSSCVQCHLAGVDLKSYILPSHEKTFLSMRDQGMIDLDNPEKSKILQLIQRGSSDTSGPNLIHTKVRQSEFDAFTAWIKACANDKQLRAAPKLDPKEVVGATRPVEVIRHARTDRLLESFERNVWSMRFRCMNCHIEGTPQNEKFRAQFGDGVAWIKKGGASATMNYLLSSKFLNDDQPEKSLLLQKPLGEVKHQGGIKFIMGDEGYKGFRAWIDDVAAIRKDRFKKASDLPPKETGPARFGTEIWVKLTDTKPEWADKLLEVRIHAWDQAKKVWEADPIAATDRLVNGKMNLWQHTLTLLATEGTERAKMWKQGAPSLPQGAYLIKIYVDTSGKIAKDWKTRLADADLVGQIEVTSRWQPGYGAMTGASIRKLVKP